MAYMWIAFIAHQYYQPTKFPKLIMIYGASWMEDDFDRPKLFTRMCRKRSIGIVQIPQSDRIESFNYRDCSNHRTVFCTSSVHTHTHSFGPIYSFNNHVLVGEMKRNKMLHANPDIVQFIFSPVLCVFSVNVVYLQRLHALLLFKERRKKPYESVLSYHFQHSIDFIHIGCHCSVLSLSLCMGESIDAKKSVAFERECESNNENK